MAQPLTQAVERQARVFCQSRKWRPSLFQAALAGWYTAVRVKMFLRYNTRKKDGKEHRYWSVVENRRLRAGHTTQRTVLYLGEINDTQQAAWRKSLEVFNEIEQLTEQICLFPEDRDIPPEVLNGLKVKLSELTLERPRVFGDCWLGCRLWDELQLEEFWRERLPARQSPGAVV